MFIKNISVSRIAHFAGFFCTFVFCIGLEIMCERMKPDNKCAFFYIIAIRLLCAEQAHISLETQGNNTQLGLNHLWGIWLSVYLWECQWLEPFTSYTSLSHLPNQGRESFSWLQRHSLFIATQIYIEKSTEEERKRIWKILQIFFLSLYYYSGIFWWLAFLYFSFFSVFWDSFDPHNKLGQVK